MAAIGLAAAIAPGNVVIYDGNLIPQTPGLPAGPRDEALRRLAAMADEPGVAASSGPFSELLATGTVGGSSKDLIVEARGPERAAVDHPLLTQDSWLDSGGWVVVENGLATAFGVKPGDTVTIAGHTLTVNGTAATVSRPPYPKHQPGWVWVTPTTTPPGPRRRPAEHSGTPRRGDLRHLAGELAPARLSAATFAVIAVAAPLAYTLVVAAPTRLLARQSVATVLAYE